VRYVDRTTTYANAPPSAATRDRVARPVRTQHGRRAPAPAPAPRVLAVPSGVPSGSYWLLPSRATGRYRRNTSASEVTFRLQEPFPIEAMYL
jgi:hypothetical protein